MDRFVAQFVSKADSLINNLANTGFISVLEAFNGIAATLAVFAICVLIFNHFLQYKYIPIERLLGLFIKLILIGYLGFQWSHLGEIVYAVQNGMDSIASKLMTLSSSSTKLSVADAIDNLIRTLIEKKKAVDSNYDWSTNATMTIAITWQLSLLGCLGALILIYCKIMLAAYLCAAPIFITCYMFEQTKGYFYRWLQGAISYTLYPVITAVVIGMTYAIIMAYINSLTVPEIVTITIFNPFIAIASMMMLVIISIPFIVSGLSGTIQNIPASQVINHANTMAFRQFSSTAVKYQSPSGLQPNPMQQQSPSPSTSHTITQPSGPFPGEPSQMLARELRIHGDRSKS